MSSLIGPHVIIPNHYARFFLIVFCGIIAFATLIMWRGQLYFNAEYVDFTNPRLMKKQSAREMAMPKQNQQELQQQLNQ